MKVCLVTSRYPPGLGGVAASSFRLARYLRDAGYDLHVVATYPGGDPPVAETSHEESIAVHRLTFAPDSNAGQFFFRAFVRDLDAAERFDLFHAFFLTMVPACAAAVSQRSRPLIASIRGSDAVWLVRHPVVRRLVFSGLRHAAWLTSVNAHLLDEIAQAAGLSARSSVIRSGVAPSAGGEWRLDEGNRGHVGTTGDFRPVKDIPLLVRGYAAVPDTLRRGLILAGGFSHAQEEAWSSTLVRELGVASEVEITGPFQPADARALLRRMHVYALTSAWEGMPNGLLEAAACGLPLVAAASPGVAEIVDDGDTGLLVPHGDPRALGDALARVLGDDGLAAALSNGARRLASAYSVERERAAWLDLYARLAPPPVHAPVR